MHLRWLVLSVLVAAAAGGDLVACTGEDPILPADPSEAGGGSDGSDGADGAGGGDGAGGETDGGGDAWAGACTVDGEAFHFCDDFDDVDAADASFLPTWSMASAGGGARLVRTGEAPVSPPYALLTETPSAEPPADAGYAAAQLLKEFAGDIRRIVLDYDQRIDAPDRAPPSGFGASVRVVSLYAGNPLPLVYVGALLSATRDDDAGALRPSLASQSVLGPDTVRRSAWAPGHVFGAWRRVRQELTIHADRGQIHEVALVDGVKVLEWNIEIPPGTTFTRATVTLGLYSGWGPDGQPAWRVRYDDVKIIADR